MPSTFAKVVARDITFAIKFLSGQIFEQLVEGFICGLYWHYWLLSFLSENLAVCLLFADMNRIINVTVFLFVNDDLYF